MIRLEWWFTPFWLMEKCMEEEGGADERDGARTIVQ